MIINIRGLDQNAVVAALYNASRPLGMSHLNWTPNDMTPEQAGAHRKDLRAKGAWRFDYLGGRVMKVELVDDVDEFEARLYDRDNGEGAAARAVASLIPKEA